MASFVYSYNAEIFLITSFYNSRAAQGKYYNGFTNSVLGSTSSSYIKQEFPYLLHIILLALLKRRYYGSSRAIRAIKAWEIRLSSISGSHKRDSLYRADAWVVL
jgi:hypothetical protein